MRKSQHPAASLRAWLRRKDWPAVQLARVLGVHEAQVSRWLSKKQRPGHALAVRLDLLTEGAVPANDWVWAFPAESEAPQDLSDMPKAAAGGSR